MNYNIKTTIAAAFALCMTAQAATAATNTTTTTTSDPFDYDGIFYKVKTVTNTVPPSSVSTATLVQGWAYEFNYQEKSGEFNIPAYIDYKGEKVPVIAIGNGAFAQTPNITKITVPSTVQSIGTDVFKNAKALEEVIFEDSEITTLSSGLFNGCANLKRVVFPASATTWNTTNAFTGCANLKSVEFPANSQLATVSGGATGTGAFNGCSALRTFTFPATVKSVSASYMFQNSGVETVKFLDNTEVADPANSKTWTTITGTYLFAFAPELKSVTLQTYLNYWYVNTTIGSLTTDFAYAFSNCSKLAEVNFPEGCTVTKIGAYFLANSGIKTFKMPAKVITMMSYTFANCANLESVEMPEALTSLGTYTFSNCTALKSVKFGNKLTTLPGYTFANCSALEAVELPTSLTTIDASALRNATGLKSIVIPEGVTKIDSYAFYGDTNLEYVIMPSTLTTCNTVFDATNKSLKAIVARAPKASTMGTVTNIPGYATLPIYVPSEAAVTSYKATNNWKNFTNFIVAGELTMPETATLYLNEKRSLDPTAVNNVDAAIEPLPVLWKSSNPAVVAVDAQGYLTALAETTEPVTITGSLWGQEKTTAVNVIANPYMITAYNLTLKPGEVIAPSAYLAFNSNATSDMTLPQNPVFEWTVADENIVSVTDNGCMSAKALGKTMATATYRGATATILVAVQPDGNLAIESEATINKGQTAQLNPAFIFNGVGDDFDASKVKWTSSADMVVFVDGNGKVFGAREGSAVVTGDYFGKTATCTVTVNPAADVAPETFTLIVHMPQGRGAMHVLNATDGTLVEFEPYSNDRPSTVHHDGTEIGGSINNNRYNISNSDPSTPTSTLRVTF